MRKGVHQSPTASSPNFSLSLSTHPHHTPLSPCQGHGMTRTAPTLAPRSPHFTASWRCFIYLGVLLFPFPFVTLFFAVLRLYFFHPGYPCTITLLRRSLAQRFVSCFSFPSLVSSCLFPYTLPQIGPYCTLKMFFFHVGNARMLRTHTHTYTQKIGNILKKRRCIFTTRDFCGKQPKRKMDQSPGLVSFYYY